MSNLLASIRRLPTLSKKQERPVESGHFYKVHKCGEYGYPFKPTNLSYDSHLQLLAIVTQSGCIKIYGRPGVEFSAQHEERVEIVKCQFIPNQGRLVTLTANNCLHIWELLPYKSSKDILVETARLIDCASSVDIRAGPQACITSLLVTSDGLNLILGSDSGSVALLDLPEPTREKGTRSHGFQEWKKPSIDCIFDINRITKSLDSQRKRKFKLSAVTTIIESPQIRGQFFIGYSNGVGVVYDLPGDKLIFIIDAEKELEAAYWLNHQIMTSHVDGSLITWSVRDTSLGGEAKSVGPPNMPYGPFPCKSITKLLWRETSKEKLLVFAGGMPRSTYGEKDTVSLVQGERELCLDLTSPLVDMIIIDHHNTHEPHILLLILHEEMLAVNLMVDKWPILINPYLNCLHYSDITTMAFIADADQDFIRKLRRAGESSGQTKNSRCWSLQGGKLLNNNGFNSNDLLLIGHADGSVDFWCLSAGDCLQRIYTLHTALLFESDYTPPSNLDDVDSENNEWPPFRRVCTFDPLSDDVRLSVTCIDLVGADLVVGGAAGQVTVWRFTDSNHPLQTIDMDIMPATKEVVWKGHKALDLRAALDYSDETLLKPQCLLQLSPPSNVTSLSWIGSSCLLAGGTSYGVAVADFGPAFSHTPRPLVVRCSVPDSTRPEFVEGWARRRTREIKKSLRDSFRRLRRLRSTHGADHRRTMRQAECGGTVKAPTSELDAMELAPVEREVEFRRPATASSTAVRCCVFASLHMSGHRPNTGKFKMPASVDRGTSSAAAAITTAASAVKDLTKGCMLSFFVGTSSGLVLFYRWVDDQLVLWKELQLNHMAPLLELIVLDAKTHRPVSEPFSDVPVSASQELLVVTEEQVRLFSLPSLSLKHKQRITAKDGNRVKRASVVAFAAPNMNTTGSLNGSSLHLNSANHSTDSPFVLLSNNAGQAILLSLPYLKRVDTSALPLENNDVLAVNSVTFAKSRIIKSSSEESQRAGGCSLPLGVFHKPPGQVCLFEVLPAANKIGLGGQSYMAYCTLDKTPTSNRDVSNSSFVNGSVSQMGDTSLSYPGSSSHPDSGIHVTSLESSMPDSIREFSPISSSSRILN